MWPFSKKQNVQNATSISSITSEQYQELFSALPSSSGVNVTAESAKRSAAVYACVRLIAGSISLLPIKVYERKNGSRVETDHDYEWLLNEEPYPTLTASSFWDWQIANVLLRGDGIGKLEFNKRGALTSIYPIARQNVIIEKEGKTLFYYVQDVDRRFGMEQADALHIPGFGFNGICGESVIKYAAKQATGAALAADQYSGEYFANNATPSLVVTYPAGSAPTPEQQEQLRKYLSEKLSGQGNRHMPAVLANGGKLEPISITATDSQLLETRQFQVEDIARAFGVPSHMIGSSANTTWGSGIEQMSMGYVRYTLGPYLRRIEQELNRKLWPARDKYFVEFDRNALLAGDSKAEAEYFVKALGGPGAQGWMSVNEVRRSKNLEPMPDGDQVIKATQQQTPASNQNAASGN